MRIARDRKALITGGGSGFGLATAWALAEQGTQVVIADVAEHLEEVAAGHERLHALHLDVRRAADVRAGVAAAVAMLGGLDTLVLCAGVIHVKPLEEVAEAEWDLTLDVNLKGAFLAAQAAAPVLRESGRGRIVAISSDAGRRGFPWIHAYCASKFGLIGLCESLAGELAQDKITVNCVCPAACPTTAMGQGLVRWKAAFTNKTEEQIVTAITSSFPLGRYVQEEDVVSAILYFISEQGSFLTGVALDIDGGERLSASIPAID